VTKQVALTTQPPSENVSLSVQNVAITVKIVSRLTEKDIKQKFSVVSGPELSSYLQKRNWKFEPADRMLTITFSVPNSTANQFSTEDITPILMLPPEEIEAIQDPTRPHTVSTEDFITVLIDRSIENRARIQREEIQPKTIKFVPVESDE
jgi:archaellum component FlaG (FlaF/FlaG flagellin family)